MIQTERKSWKKSKSIQSMANVEHYSVSTIKRLRGEKRETIILKSRAALSRGGAISITVKPVNTDTKETIESVHINRVSLLSGLCYYRKKTPFTREKYKRTI